MGSPVNKYTWNKFHPSPVIIVASFVHHQADRATRENSRWRVECKCNRLIVAHQPRWPTPLFHPLSDKKADRSLRRLWNQQSTVIISASANSANFGITRFKSNCRNSTECRLSASATDNICRWSANQRKTATTSRQEASSQLPSPYFIGFFRPANEHSLSPLSSVAGYHQCSRLPSVDMISQHQVGQVGRRHSFRNKRNGEEENQNLCLALVYFSNPSSDLLASLVSRTNDRSRSKSPADHRFVQVED